MINICEDCRKEFSPMPSVTEGRVPLCYDCLHMRYLAYKAENKKNFDLLCQTEERLAKALFKSG